MELNVLVVTSRFVTSTKPHITILKFNLILFTVKLDVRYTQFSCTYYFNAVIEIKRSAWGTNATRDKS